MVLPLVFHVDCRLRYLQSPKQENLRLLIALDQLRNLFISSKMPHPQAPITLTIKLFKYSSIIEPALVGSTEVVARRSDPICTVHVSAFIRLKKASLLPARAQFEEFFLRTIGGGINLQGNQSLKELGLTDGDILKATHFLVQ